MGSMFGKAPKPPPVPPPVPIPTVSPDTEDVALRKQRKMRGFQRTIVTGDLVPSRTPGTKTVLG